MRAELERRIRSEDGDYIDATWLAMIRIPMALSYGLCGLVLIGSIAALVRPLSSPLSVSLVGIAVFYAAFKALQVVLAIAEFSWVYFSSAYRRVHPDEARFIDLYRKISPILLVVSFGFSFFLYQNGVLSAMADV